MYEFKVSGMTCGGCVRSVTNALKTLDATAEINVDLPAQMVKIKSTKAQQELHNTIEDAGYTVLESKIS